MDDNLLTAGRRNATERVAMLLMHLYRRLDRIGLVEEGSVAFRSTSSTLPTRSGCRWCTPTRRCGACWQLGLHELKTGGCVSLTPARWRALPVLRHTAPADATAVAPFAAGFGAKGRERGQNRRQLWIYVAFCAPQPRR